MILKQKLCVCKRWTKKNCVFRWIKFGGNFVGFWKDFCWNFVKYWSIKIARIHRIIAAERYLSHPRTILFFRSRLFSFLNYQSKVSCVCLFVGMVKRKGCVYVTFVHHVSVESSGISLAFKMLMESRVMSPSDE
jgi:hypothetical protein